MQRRRPPRRRAAERLRALLTIFLPIIRLPTPPTTAPMPTGSILPNAIAPRLSVYRLTKYRSSREFSCDTAGSGSVAAPSDSQAPLVRPGPSRSATACLLSSPDQHRQHQGAAALAVIGGNAVDLGDARARKPRWPRGTPPSHRRPPTARPACRCPGNAAAEPDRGAAGHHGGQVVLLQLVDDVGGRRVRVVPAQPVDVGLDRRPLHSRAALDDLRQHLGGGARVVVEWSPAAGSWCLTERSCAALPRRPSSTCPNLQANACSTNRGRRRVPDRDRGHCL